MHWLFALHLLNFLPWWVIALRRWMPGLPYLVASLVLFQFTWVSPFWLWANGVNHLAGVPYNSAWPEALAVYIIGVGIYNTAWLSGRQAAPKPQARPWPPLPRWLPILFLAGCMSLAVLSYQLSGVSVLQVFNPFNRDLQLNLYGLNNRFPILEGFADSLVPATGLALLFSGAGALAFAIPALWLLLMAGFRYRLILLGISLFLYLLLQVNARIRPWLIVGTLVLGMAGILVLTVNRALLVSRGFSSLGVYRESINLGLVVHETNNTQTFLACLASPYRPALSPDQGRSLLWSPIVRFLPRGLFPEGRKPRANTLTLIRMTVDQTPEAARLHPALSNLEEYYLSAGIPGLAIGMALLGLAAAWLGLQLASVRNAGALYAACIGTAFLFQVISRGYVPQQAELVVYLSLPLLALYLYYRYAPASNRNTTPEPD